jgi:hypothetical protein
MAHKKTNVQKKNFPENKKKEPRALPNGVIIPSTSRALVFHFRNLTPKPSGDIGL